MKKHNLNSLNPAKFAYLIKNRELSVSSADAAYPLAEFSPNTLANSLHPKKQKLRITEISDFKNCKAFKLSGQCACFTAGQYINVYVNIDGKVCSRPYSLASSPKDASDGFYQIAVKAVDGGLVSNYILQNWSVGTLVEVSDPIGNFTYEPLRDCKNVVGIAGGSGITPFMSLAKSVLEGSEDFNLTILYGCRKEEDILFRFELDSLAEKCDRLKVIYVLSEECKEGFEQGNISYELVKKYAPKGEFSVFICGPEGMTRFVDKELELVDFERKFIRHEVHGETISPSNFKDYPQNVPEIISITVWNKGESKLIKASPAATVVRILEQNGITPPTRCRSGECGFCHSRLISGEVFIPKELNKLRQADNKFGFIHPCCSYPLTDIEIEIS